MNSELITILVVCCTRVVSRVWYLQHFNEMFIALLIGTLKIAYYISNII